MENVILPALCIADYAFPAASAASCEGSGIFSGFDRLETEYLDVRPAFPLEMKSCRHNLRVVEHHDRPLGKQ